jgi:hypothetical protein
VAIPNFDAECRKNAESANAESDFGIGASAFFRHSGFGIHSLAPFRQFSRASRSVLDALASLGYREIPEGGLRGVQP